VIICIVKTDEESDLSSEESLTEFIFHASHRIHCLFFQINDGSLCLQSLFIEADDILRSQFRLQFMLMLIVMILPAEEDGLSSLKNLLTQITCLKEISLKCTGKFKLLNIT